VAILSAAIVGATIADTPIGIKVIALPLGATTEGQLSFI